MPALRDAAGAITVAYSRVYESEPRLLGAATALTRGLKVALPHLIDRDDGESVSLATVVDDLIFMSHYYLLRECLYYTYNKPGSLHWQFNGDEVTIALADPSIPRQFSLAANSNYLLSGQVHDELGASHSDEIRSLLTGAEEFGEHPHSYVTAQKIGEEVDTRFKYEYSFLSGHRREIQFLTYSYSQAHSILRYLLIKALYHRYYALANNTWCTFQYPKDALATEISLAVELPESTVIDVLADVTYSRRTLKVPPMYFHLYDHPNNPEYIMLPDNLAGADIMLSFLRVVATTSSEWFLRHVSGPLGTLFTEGVAQSFRDAGFIAMTNMSLAALDNAAPDIDVLVISKEATLGYCVYILECKATLPALWAKDHLRLLDPSTLPKAFSQVKRILDVLGTESGVQFLRSLLDRHAPHELDDIVVAVRSLIVTAQNNGMFFDNAQTTVIDLPMLRQILRQCDGDVVYLNRMLHDLRTLFGRPEDVTSVSCDVDGLRVTYPAVITNRIVEFSANQWKSSGLDREVAEEFFASGGSPFDVFDTLPDADSDDGDSAATQLRCRPPPP